jgi:DHA2 family multidrug resistance protein-like MFS transporter
MVLLLAVGPRLLPEHRDPSAGRLDLASAALALAAILPAIYGLKEIAREGVGSLAVLAVLAGITFGTAFVRRQRVLAGPMLDLTLFANRRFGVPVLVMLAAGVVMAGTSFMASQYLQQALGLSPLAAGLWTIPQNVAMVISTNIAPVLARRFNAARVVPAGLLLAGAGIALLTQADPAGGAAVVAGGMVVASFGIGLPMILLTGVVLGSVPAEKAGAAASIQETAGEFGIALGVATLGSLGMAIYKGDLLDGVSAAFTAGLAAVAAVGGVIFLVLALVVAALNRR